MVDSLQEAFFVLDDLGAVIEINSAFTEILGYGPDGLPYLPQHPWWPDPEAEPEAHRLIVDAFAGMPENPDGTYTVPVTHRDGHRVWISASIAHVDDPESGRSVLVGTFRDVTAEHYTVQRQTALAVLNQQLAQADTVDDAMVGAAEQMRQLWRARRVLAATFPARTIRRQRISTRPEVVCTGEAAGWEELPAQARRTIRALGHSGDLLTADDSMPGSAGIALQHPRGILVLWLELDEQRPFTAEDLTLLTVLAGRLGQGLQRVHQLDQQRETALALQHSILGPAQLPGGFAVRYPARLAPAAGRR